MLLAPPDLAEARPKRRQRVVIVGGGIAGLTAAMRLHDLHIPCTVYEASGRLGGRMFSNSPSISGSGGYWDEGQVSEWCGELIDTGHQTMRALARRFHLTLDDLKAAEPKGATEAIFFDGEHYTATVEDFAPVYAAVKKDAKAAGYPTTYLEHTPAGLALDALSVYDWIETRVPGGHGSKVGKLLDVAYTIEYGADTRDQSSLNLIYLLSGWAKGDVLLFGESDERFHIRGGNQRLPLEIAKFLPQGTVVTGQRLTAFARNPDGTVALTFQSAAKTTQVVADRVIFALPFAVLRKLSLEHSGFDGRKRVAIQELGAGRSSKLMLQFKTRHWHTAGPNGIGNGDSYSDLPYQGSWEATRGQPGSAGILVGYTGGAVVSKNPQRATFSTARQELTAAAADRMAKELDQVFPGLGAEYNGKANLSLPHLDPNFACAYSYYRVGQYRRFAGYEKVRQGNIHFAGEHCSLEYQGFMEGGASEGLRAANEVAQRLRRR
jgi:monoamine oxidase